MFPGMAIDPEVFAKANDALRRSIAYAGWKHSAAAHKVGMDAPRFSRKLNGQWAECVAALYLLGPTVLSQLCATLGVPRDPLEEKVQEHDRRINALEGKKEIA